MAIETNDEPFVPQLLIDLGGNNVRVLLNQLKAACAHGPLEISFQKKKEKRKKSREAKGVP